MNNNILESAKMVVDNSKFVSINQDKLKELANEFSVPSSSNWLLDSPYDIIGLTDDEKLMFCLIFNGLSFSYWGEPYWNVSYDGNEHKRGSWSLVACIFRSIEEGNSLLEIENLKNFTLDDLKFVLRGNSEIPLIRERLEICNTIGKVLFMKYENSFASFIKTHGNDAQELQLKIIEEFAPAFDDSWEYNGETVSFNKRAQAIVESVHSIFDGKRIGNIKNIDSLTALADYIIPNLLRCTELLQYDNVLASLIDRKENIEKGSEYEVEIRANTIWCVELIKQEILAKGIKTNTKSINDYLWSMGRDVDKPFHRTRTIAY